MITFNFDNWNQFVYFWLCNNYNYNLLRYINHFFMIILTFDNLCYIHLLKNCRLLYSVCSVYQFLNTPNQKYKYTKGKKQRKEIPQDVSVMLRWHLNGSDAISTNGGISYSDVTRTDNHRMMYFWMKVYGPMNITLWLISEKVVPYL